MYDLILKKRSGQALTGDEITHLVRAVVDGSVGDDQIAALLMAVWYQGMDARETADLTLAMAQSGDQVDLSPIPGIKVDKHSTGGVGDKTTLVLAPLVASAGVPVAKLSGRGLGHTGGTIDKLESIPGFSAGLSLEGFIDQVRRIGLAVAGQTANLVPADKKLYAVRDVTATVDSIPLIAASVMSKKLAGGADAIVLDVKTGSGAFVTEANEARRLARLMVDIGERLGRRTVAYLTDMDQPLGRAVGNALEVREAIATLRGEGPEDLRELCLSLGAEMVALTGVLSGDRHACRRLLEGNLRNGTALEKFRQLIAAQGGDPAVVLTPDLLPSAPVVIDVPSRRAGYVHRIDALEVGLTAMALGAGRAVQTDKIDPAVGVVLAVKVGDRIEVGQPLAEVHARSANAADAAAQRLAAAFAIGPEPPDPRPLIVDRIAAESYRPEGGAGAHVPGGPDPADRPAGRIPAGHTRHPAGAPRAGTTPHALATDDERPLLDAAWRAAAAAYVPYSHYAVGCAVRTADGRLFHGANIENASYGLTCCAERVALFKAVSEGARDIVHVAVVAHGAMPFPCGACRQVLGELAPRARLVVSDGEHLERRTVAQLLPDPFILT
ncbi:MAG TPA: pyrimidine-nucleoside phosphorylase [Bacillota bacterium]